MCGLSDEEIWDQIGLMPVGDITLANLWDLSRVLGVQPAALFSAGMPEGRA